MAILFGGIIITYMMDDIMVYKWVANPKIITIGKPTRVHGGKGKREK